MAARTTADALYDRLDENGELSSQDLQQFLPSLAAAESGTVQNEWQLTELLAKLTGGEALDLRRVSTQSNAAELVPAKLIRATRVLPLSLEDDRLVVAQYDPSDMRSIDRVKRACRRELRVVVAPRSQVRRLIDLRHGSQEEAAVDEYIKRSADEVAALRSVDRSASGMFFRDYEEELGDTPVEKLLEAMVVHAAKRRATDIHVTCHPDRVELRHRIDGVLGRGKPVPRDLHASLLSRIKLSSGMDISRHGRPQDGNFEVQVGVRKIQVRVGVFPTIYGEDVAMRLLYSEMYVLDLAVLGFSEATLSLFTRLLESNKGMILVTGPVGVGKTTTLYSSLSKLCQHRGRIITLEDPVESRVEGITQSQVSPETGYDFASGLRSILRMDPDVIMVGEIRDNETAQMALRASLTGMLVLSTLHTDRAAGAIPRLLDMEVEPFLLTSSLLGVLSQALVRRICEECKEPVEPDPAYVRAHSLPEAALQGTLWQGAGCQRCDQTGYYGRTGLFELLVVDESIRDKIKERTDTPEIVEAAAKVGMTTLMDDGLAKAHAGVTTLAELVRVLSGRQ